MRLDTADKGEIRDERARATGKGCAVAADDERDSDSRCVKSPQLNNVLDDGSAWKQDFANLVAGNEHS